MFSRDINPKPERRAKPRDIGRLLKVENSAKVRLAGMAAQIRYREMNKMGLGDLERSKNKMPNGIKTASMRLRLPSLGM